MKTILSNKTTNFYRNFIFAVCAVFFVSVGWGQTSEGFESGMPTSYTATTSYTLGSGTWTGQANGVIRGTTGVFGGSYSCQLRSQTGAQISSPILSGGVGTVTFYASISTGSGSSLQVNFSTDGGSTWNAATGSPFSLSTTTTQYTAIINNASVNRIQFLRTNATVYIDNVVISTAPVFYFWNGGTIATIPADGGSGIWSTANCWRQPTASGSQATWANSNLAIFAGTAGTVTLIGNVSPASTTFNTTGYTLVTSGSSAIVLAGNVSLSATNTNIAPISAASLSITGSVSGSGNITHSGAGTTTLTNGNTYTGTTTISSGLIAATGESAFGANPASFTANQITLNGGGIQASTGNINFSSNRGITLGASGGTFDVASSRTITALNVIAGSGSLIKSGAGILLVTGVHTYTGSTTVNGGRLELSGSGLIATTSTITVGSGANFDISGRSAALTLAAGQSLRSSATGSNTTATVTVGSTPTLTLSAGGLGFTAYGGGATAPMTVAGAGGSLALSNSPVTVFTSTALAVGTYKLIAKSGSATVTGTPGTLTMAGSGLAASTTGALSVVSGELILTVTASGLSTDANLFAYTTTATGFTPAFAAATIAYNATTTFATSTTTVTATRNQAAATLEIRVNGGSYTSLTNASPSGALALNVGANTIDVRVTAEDAITQKTYTLTVTRAAAATNANLSALTTTASSFAPAFASGTIAYTASVLNGVTSTTVTPTKEDAGATIQVQVNGGGYATVASGSASSALPLNVGSNSIDVLVTAEDGSTTKTYTLTVTRAAASSPALNAGAISGSFGNVCINTTTVENSFIITGTALTTANVTIASLSGFTFSTSSGGTYTSSLSLTQSGGAYSQTIYVKFTPTAATVFDGNIVIDGGGASSVNVAVTGAGINGTSSITTTTASSISINGANTGGTVISTTCGTITAKGVAYATTTNPTTPTTSNGTGTADFVAALSGLTPNTLYYYRAFATNSNSVTNYGSNLNFTTLHNAPTIGSGSGATQTAINANWTAPVSAGAATFTYEVAISTASDFSSTLSTQTGISSGTLTYQFTGLTAGTTYYFRARANNAGGSSAWSSISTAYATLPDAMVFTTLGTSVTENFNTLASSGTSSSMPIGWSFIETLSNANSTYAAGTGSDNVGNTYSFGSSSDRALGFLRSNTLATTFGVKMINSTGSTINNLTVSYTGETWRVGAANRIERLDFQYSLNATSVSTGTWVNVNLLDYANPGQATGSGSMQHSATISDVISGLTLANGSTIWFRWNDLDIAGDEDGMGIDDISIKPCATVLAPTGTASQSFCSASSPIISNLSATGTSIQWYAANSGGLALLSSAALANGTTYYATQTISNCESTSRLVVGAIISNVPTVDTPATPSALCVGASYNPTVPTVTANGSTVSAQGWQLEMAVGSGTYSALSVPYTVALADNGKKVRYTATNGCGTTNSATATLTINNLPSAPTGTAAQSFCSANSPTIANLIASGTSIQWYAASSGGSALVSSASLVTGTTYFATQTTSGCESASRFGVTATVNNPSAPTGTAAQSFCSANSPTIANLIASGTSIQWYAASSGGSALVSSESLVSGITYYATQTISGCESTSRFGVTATVNNPSAPTGIASQSFCTANSPTIANLSATGTSIQWYAASSGGSALVSSASLVSGTTYYATQTIGFCESATRKAASVTLTSTAIPTLVSSIIGASVANGDLLWSGNSSNSWSTVSNWYVFDGVDFTVASQIPSVSSKVYILQSNTSGICSSNNNAVIAIQGDVSDIYIGANTTLTINAGRTLSVARDWVNHGSFLPDPTSTVLFDGNSAQSIGGNTSTIFANLTIDKSSGALTLNSPISVSKTLSMLDGNIATSATNLLTVGTSTSNIGSLNWVSGSVLGPIQRYFADADNSTQESGIFPVGTAGLNRNAQVNFTSGLISGGTITAEYRLGISSFDDAGLPVEVNGQMIQNYENEGWWEITPSGGNLNAATYSLSLRGNGLSVVSSLSLLRIIKSVSHTTWDMAGIGSHNDPSGSQTDFTIVNTGLTGFSFFNIGSGNANPLPVQLIGFSANCQDSEYLSLNWSTASEQNSMKFIIEKSRDLNTWVQVGEKQAAGNSNYVLDYEMNDFEPFSGIGYYRIVQIDFDGKTKVYDPISSSCALTQSSIGVFPNPAKGDFTIELNSQTEDKKVELILQNLLGSVICKKTVDVNIGTNYYYFDNLILESGVYIVNFKTLENKMQAVKIMIEK